MRLSHLIRISWSLALCVSLPACVPGKPGDSDTAGSGSTSSTSSASDSTTSGTAPTSGASDSSTASTGETTSPTSSTASTGEATTTAATTTAGEIPAECETSDPAVAADFELQTVDWPDDAPLDDPGVLCTVDDVTDQAGTVTTALLCDVNGVSLPATLTISAAPEGPVTWAAGDSVRLRHRFYESDPGHINHLQLRNAADGSVLMFASDSRYDEVIYQDIAPLIFGIELVCREEQQRSMLPALLRFGLPDDQGENGVMHRHRGALPIDASDHYIIDVADAQASKYYGNERVVFLLRRVHVGG